MSTPRGIGPAPNREVSEAFFDFLSGAARLLMWFGLALLLIGLGFVTYTAIAFGGTTPPGPEAAALSNIAIFDKFLLAGVLALGASTTFLWWGESILGAIQLIVALLMYFGPVIMTGAGLVGSTASSSKAVSSAFESLSRNGLILGAIGLVVVLFDVAAKSKQRLQQGSKADQLRYGKGVKEEVDRHNVFLGKCWQLPFCRKFVRERCPIYHARRTCWRELTGCMCEEEVIRNAMENKPIPKDQVMAANYIPRNHKLSIDQKRDRCKSCVIYNEHQKHKYKALMPVMAIGFLLIYFLAHPILLAGVGGIIQTLDKLIGKATFNPVNDKAGNAVTKATSFHELLLACLMVILLAYGMKMLEYLIFKLKI